MQAPFFGALHALAVDDASGGTGFTFSLLATFDVKHIVDFLQCAVVALQAEVVVHQAAPLGRPQAGPSLTAAVHDGRTIVRVGTEEWLRQGPNQRMPRNGRATCRQIR